MNAGARLKCKMMIHFIAHAAMHTIHQFTRIARKMNDTRLFVIHAGDFCPRLCRIDDTGHLFHPSR